MSIEVTLRGLPADVRTEAIYLAGRFLSHSLLTNLTGQHPAISPDREREAKDAADAIIHKIEEERGAPLSHLTSEVRSEYVLLLYKFLRNSIAHGDSVKRDAEDILKRFGTDRL